MVQLVSIAAEMDDNTIETEFDRNYGKPADCSSLTQWPSRDCDPDCIPTRPSSALILVVYNSGETNVSSPLLVCSSLRDS